MPGTRLIALAAIVLADFLLPAQVARAGDDDLCRRETQRVERAALVPRGLLQAIALTESGRWDKAAKRRYSWPWTVAAADLSFFLDSKTEAIATVKRLRREGRRNIDVGCMQVNLLHHPDAFPDLDAAFDPATNVTWAAGFLRSLRDETRSWGRAVANYHNRDRDVGGAYRQRVSANWQQERFQLAAERRGGRDGALRLTRPARAGAPAIVASATRQGRPRSGSSALQEIEPAAGPAGATPFRFLFRVAPGDASGKVRIERFTGPAQLAEAGRGAAGGIPWRRARAGTGRMTLFGAPPLPDG